MTDEYRDADAAADLPPTPEADAVPAPAALPAPAAAADVVDADSAAAAPAVETSEDEAPPEFGSIRYSARQIALAREVLTRLYAARRGSRFYPLDHPAVTESVTLLADAVRVYHEEGVELQLAFYEGELLLGQHLLTEESVLFDQLIRDMTAIGVGSLTFRPDFTEAELVKTMAILGSDPEDVDRAGGIERMASEAGLVHVEIGAVRALERVQRPPGEASEEAQAAFGGAVSLMREIDRLLRFGRQVSPARVKGAVRSLVDNVLTNRHAMLQLTGLKNYDEYTFYHSANVAILSLALGSAITSDYRFLSSLGVGALLHDIGKLSIDLEILNKPGALDPQEWDAMRRHPVMGAETTVLLPGVDKAAVIPILEHHMRWDGTGYPQRAPRKKQHLASRIVAVADAYDAMTSKRSYSAARVQDEAMLTLVKSAGTSLDPSLVRMFVRVIGIYPPRSVVRLSTGQVGIVLAPNTGSPLSPHVRIIASPTGEICTPEDVDLLVTTELKITGCLDPRLINIEVDDYV